MMTTEQLKAVLDHEAKYRAYLYVRGFCITDSSLETSDYPFYGVWNAYRAGKFYIYAHKEKRVFLFENAGKHFFLIGHAYDPFSMLTDEKSILQKLASADDMWDTVNDFTGVFCVGVVSGETIQFTVDAAGQQVVYYGVVNHHVWIASHSKMVGDLCGLEQDAYIKRLIHYRFFHLLGMALPGDLSPYKELKRAQCNFITRMDDSQYDTERLWPRVKIQVQDDEAGYQETLGKISDLLHRNMVLISEKWPNRKAAISVTGGMDSQMTMASAVGLYDRFSYFSYDSLPDEKVDADAAHMLCEKLGLPHRIYTIPEELPAYHEMEIWREIMAFNSGCIGYNHLNDVKKRLFFTAIQDFDIEVKSWVDEIGRARYHKRFHKKRFPNRPTPRYLTSLYKVFFHNRKLVKETDAVFEHYLHTYYGNHVFELAPWWDLFYWEFQWNAAEGLFLTGEHLFAYDITIPYNNRRLLALMLSVPLERRITDNIQKSVIHIQNPAIEAADIHVIDVSHTKMRAYMERVYLEISTRLPF